MTDHNNLTGAIAVHPAWYIQSTDPGAVGAHKGWVDTSVGLGTTTQPYPLKKRNATNTGWDVIAGTPQPGALLYVARTCI